MTSLQDDERADARLRRAHADFVLADGPGSADPLRLAVGVVRAAAAVVLVALRSARGADPVDAAFPQHLDAESGPGS